MALKLGRDTGSFSNYLMSGTRGQPDPVVGMGATLLSWTDRHPATIVSVEKVGKKIIVGVRKDDAVRIDNNGMSECQQYEFTPRADGHVSYFRFDGDHKGWRGVSKKDKRWCLNGGSGLRIGERDKYHDFSF